MLGFLEKLTLQPDEVSARTPTPFAPPASGRGDRDAIHVCALFNMIVRMADSLGCDVPPPDSFLGRAEQMLEGGYCSKRYRQRTIASLKMPRTLRSRQLVVAQRRLGAEVHLDAEAGARLVSDRRVGARADRRCSSRSRTSSGRRSRSRRRGRRGPRCPSIIPIDISVIEMPVHLRAG